MNDAALRQWFEENKNALETAYLAGIHSWQQSGVGLHTPHSASDWETLRRPIADCVASSGAFLDIGCANGYLLECVLRWTQQSGLAIVPYGLDFSDRLIALARARLPDHADHLYSGNAWDWRPPQTFDYVNATLYYVPEELRAPFVHRLLARYVKPGGRLLLAEYLGRSTGTPAIRIDEELRRWGFTLEMVRSSHLAWEPMIQTRVAVIRKTTP